MNKKPSYYSVLTSKVRYDNKLTDSEKLLYAEITSLTQATGECWASNKYFADNFNVSERTITRRIRNLEKHGHIKVKYVYKKDSKYIESRTISIVEQYDNSDPQYDKSDTPKYDNPVQLQYDKTVGENTTSKSNTTSINNKPYSPLEAFELFWNIYPKKVGKKPSQDKFLKLLKSDDNVAEKIFNDVLAKSNTKDWKKDNGKYVPNPMTYLNQERWNDNDGENKPDIYSDWGVQRI